MADMMRRGNPAWSDVKNYIDDRIEELHNNMEFSDEWGHTLRFQGAIRELRTLRDIGEEAPIDG